MTDRQRITVDGARKYLHFTARSGKFKDGTPGTFYNVTGCYERKPPWKLIWMTERKLLELAKWVKECCDARGDFR